MKIGQEVSLDQSQQIRQVVTDALASTPETAEVHQLVTGLSTTLWNSLLQLMLDKVTTALQDPATLQWIVTNLIGLFTKKS